MRFPSLFTVVFTLTATLGNLTVGDAGALNDVFSGTGIITLTASEDEATIQIATDADVETSRNDTSTDGLIITSDKIDIDGTITASNTIVKIQPETAVDADQINLGSTVDSGANTLELSDSELDAITAGILRVGSSASGNLSISSAISSGATTTLSLITGGTITQTGTVTETNLALSAADDVNMNQNNTVDTLAAFISES